MTGAHFNYLANEHVVMFNFIHHESRHVLQDNTESMNFHK